MRFCKDIPQAKAETARSMVVNRNAPCHDYNSNRENFALSPHEEAMRHSVEIESFLSYVKRSFSRSNGTEEEKSILFLARYPSRYNHRNKNLMDVSINEYATVI